jgi:gamma-glutamylcyclotransferase
MRAGAAERPNGHHRGVSTSPFVIYFAYGSNMLWQRIRARVPSARPLGGAILHGHRLAWHKSGRDGSGKCDVVPIAEAGHAVHGVLYEILAAEKPALDLAEGLGVDYDEKQVEVETRTGPVTAWVYLAMRTDPTVQPYAWYKAIVLAGAREHGLPDEYIARLDAALPIDDPDAARHAAHIALTIGR